MKICVNYELNGRNEIEYGTTDQELSPMEIYDSVEHDLNMYHGQEVRVLWVQELPERIQLKKD